MIALVSVSLKKSMFWIIKKSALLLKKGWFLSKSQRKGGLFLHPENTDGLPVSYGSGGTGFMLVVTEPSLFSQSTTIIFPPIKELVNSEMGQSLTGK